MKKKLLITGMLVFAVLWSTHASAQPCRRMASVANANQAGWGCPTWQNLAPEQQTAIKNLRNDFMKKSTPIQNQIHKKRLEMDLLLLEADSDENKLIKLQKEISDLSAKLDKEQLLYRIKARKNLNQAQIDQLPPGCSLGIGNHRCGPGGGNSPCLGRGMGCGMRSGQYGGGCW